MNFKNLEKCFKKCVKIYFSQNFKCLVVFEVGYTILLPTAFKFDIKLHSKPFFLKKAYFCINFLTIKKLWIEDIFSEKGLNFCPFKVHILRKNHFMSLALDQK